MLHLIFDITTILVAEVTQHLTQYPFQTVVTNLSAGRPFGRFHRLVAVIADVDRCAIQVATVIRSIEIATAQTFHITLGAGDTGDDNLVERDILHIEAVEERLADVVEQNGRTRHEIWNAGGEIIDMEIGVAAHVNQFLLSMFRLLSVLHRRHPILAG